MTMGLRAMSPPELADDVIGLFLEYRDSYGYDEQRARSAAIQEVIEAEQAREEITAEEARNG